MNSKSRQNKNTVFSVDEILYDSSRFAADLAVKIISKNPSSFASFVEASLSGKYPVSMRAARVVQLCCENNREIFIPYILKYVGRIVQSPIDGVRRSYLKVYTENCDLRQVKDLGLLISKAFEWISDSGQPVAIRAYSMDLLKKVIAYEPDLLPEFKVVLAEQLNSTSVGLRTKAAKMLKDL